MRSKRAKRALLVILLFLIAFYVLLFYSCDDAASQYARYEIKNAVTALIYDEFTSVTQKYGARLKDTARTVTEGEITYIQLDSALLNEIASDVAFGVTRRLEDAKDSFAIPLGNLTNIKLLSGKGPGIKLTVIPLGRISVGTESALSSAGINQTLHRVSVRVNALVSVLTPFTSDETEITAEYAVCETLIIGKVPELYYRREAIP